MSWDIYSARLIYKYIVEVEEVQTGLSKIKLTKAGGPDNVPHEILKELATSLAPQLHMFS